LEKAGTVHKTGYILLLVFQCAIFGFSFIVLKSLLTRGYPIFFLLGIRFLIGAILLFFVGRFLIAGRKKKTRRFGKKESVYGLIAGAAVFIAFALQTWGLNFTTPAKNGLFTGLYVIFVPLILMVWKKKADWRALLLGLVCFCGMAVVSGFFTEQLNFTAGDSVTILSAAVFAIHFILLEKFLSNATIDFFDFTIIQLLAVAVFSLVISSLFEEVNYRSLETGSFWMRILFLGILSTALAYYIQTVVQSELSANTVSVLSCSESVFAVVFSIGLGYDSISFTLLVGTLIMIGSMALTSVRKEEKVF